MTIICTCGCEVDDFEHARNVIHKIYVRDNSRAIAYSVYCGPCEDKLRQQGMLFGTEEEAIAWLKRDYYNWGG